ncbi:hypothetical protein CHS0354_027844 [Potamilus streckersoni]|uniref:Uncharacterized protein n=1 Tax=Potamilus streckersoni TaxID=2493646 RepID=A0AAE0T0L6_9BIVA|nr:hypothetical protein CHS0354_027844 [Potamilus streckersoni]
MAKKRVAVFHQPFSFILIASFVTVTVSYIDIDMEKCSNCTGRADVPCIVQHLSHWCQHPKYSSSWPGAPQDLTAKSLKLNGKWFANFSWKPPYDSSLKSLEGFHLTVNVLEQEIYGIGHPDCFFINLTQVDWTKVEDRHNVLFHFDCISSENPVTVFIMVTSSPAPSSKAQRKDIAIQLPVGDVNIVERAKRHYKKGVGRTFYEPDWNVTINVKKEMVDGCPEVHVRFEPLYPSASAHTVLVYPIQSEEAEEFVTLEVPKNYTVFKNLPSNKTYFVLIKPENEEISFMWRANGSVFIEECKTGIGDISRSNPRSNYIALIIVCGIFLVAIVTACSFCLIRTRHNGIDSFDLFVICKTRPPVRYAAAQTGEAPNNMTDFASETKRVLCVLHSNHPKMKQACQALCRLLQKTSTLDVLTTEEILSNRDPLNTTHLQDVPLLILDEIMMQLWKDDSDGKSIHDSGAVANIIRMVKKTHCVDDILFVSLFSKEQRCWKSLIPDIGKKLYYISTKTNVECDHKLELNPVAISELLAQLPGCKVDYTWMDSEEARMFERSIQSLAPTCENDDGVQMEYSMVGLESASAVDGERYCSWSSSLSSSHSTIASASPNKSPYRKSNERQIVHPENECSLHYPNDSGHAFHGKNSTDQWVEQQSSINSNFARVKSKLCCTSDCPNCQTEPLLGSDVCVYQNGSAIYINEKSITTLRHFPKIEGYRNSFIPCHNGQVVTGKGNIRTPYHLDSFNARSGQINPDIMTGRYKSSGHVIHSPLTGSSAVRCKNSNRDHRCRMHHACDCGYDHSEEFIGPESDEESTTDSVLFKKLMDLNKRNGYLPKKEDV